MTHKNGLCKTIQSANFVGSLVPHVQTNTLLQTGSLGGLRSRIYLTSIQPPVNLDLSCLISLISFWSERGTLKQGFKTEEQRQSATTSKSNEYISWPIKNHVSCPSGIGGQHVWSKAGHLKGSLLQCQLTHPFVAVRASSWSRSQSPWRWNSRPPISHPTAWDCTSGSTAIGTATPCRWQNFGGFTKGNLDWTEKVSCHHRLLI